MATRNMSDQDNANRDPVSGEPGSHPLGTGLGAAAGGMTAGAAAGAVGGPIGAVAGAVVGAVVGGMGGHAAAEAINPTEEQAYWRENYDREPYYESGRSFEDYAPAYGVGLYGRTNFEGSWDESEPQLAREWESRRERSSLSWDQAREPSRAAWQRIDQRLTQPSEGDDLRVGRSGTQLGEGTRYATEAERRSGAGSSTEADMGLGFGSARSGEEIDQDEVVDTLNDLLECCRDGEYGFQECAEHTQSTELKSVFMRRADDCRQGAQQLMERLRQYGETPDEGGTVTGAMHRGWVAVKGTLAGYSDRAMLEECERGEDAAVARYRKALAKNLPSDVRTMVEQQAQGVKRNHDEIKRLRDAVKDRV